MKLLSRITVAAALVAVAWATACSNSGQSGPTEPAAPPTPAAVEALRATLAPYASLKLAKDAGYDTQITDCMSNGDVGAMGEHFGKLALIDDKLDANVPEVLIYEPGVSGALSLVGVEFVVPFALVPKSAQPPTLFGQAFTPDDVFGLWTLHVWTHRANPSGLFAQWNPRVHC
jgi:hypothetical protein